MNDLVWFRLCVLLGVLTSALFGGYAVYAKHESDGWHKAIAPWNKLWDDANIRCAQTHDSYPCGSIAGYKEEIDGIVVIRDEYSERAELCARLAAVVPLTLVVAFYGLRWALTGRIRPLVPKDGAVEK